MAQRRMFTPKIVRSDAFLSMSRSARELYFQLNFDADDEGFVSNPKTVMRVVGAQEDDLNLLFAKRFVIGFDSGIVVIKHWWLHNQLRKDRYIPTEYIDEKRLLYIKPNKSYTLDKNQGVSYVELTNNNGPLATKWQPNGNQMTTAGCHNISKYNLIKRNLSKDNLTDDNTDRNKDISPKRLSESPCAIIKIPLISNQEYPITQKNIEEWQDAYPIIDVLGELKKLRAWCIANPDRKKTSKGVMRFINTWLSKEQDKGIRTRKDEANNNISADFISKLKEMGVDTGDE